MDRNSKLNKTFHVPRPSPHLVKNEGKTRVSLSSPTLPRPGSPASRASSVGKKLAGTKLPVTSRDRVVTKSLSLNNNNREKTPEKVLKIDDESKSTTVKISKDSDDVPDSGLKTPKTPTLSDVLNINSEKEAVESPEKPVLSTPSPAITPTSGTPPPEFQDQDSGQKKARKTWNLSRRTDLTRLIMMENMAQEGCDVSQLQLAKDLLEDQETSTRSQRKENDRKAVSWLIKSAEQGNLEARKLLQDCLKAGRGITWQNISDIKDCISTSLGQKLVVRAANRLFDKLNNDEDFITTTQIHLYVTSPKGEDLNRTYDVFENGSATPVREGDQPDLVSGNFTMIHRNDDSKIIEESDDDDRPDDGGSTLNFNLDAGRQLTRAKLLEIAKAYNKGNLPDVRLNPGDDTTRFLDHGVATVGALVIGLFLLLEVTLKAMNVNSALLIASTLVAIFCSYCFLVWQRRRELFREWTRAFIAALPKLTETDLADCFNICKTQLIPLYGLNLISLLLLHVLHAPRIAVGFASALSIYTVFQGILQSGSRWRLLLAAALTYTMKSKLVSTFVIVGCSEDTTNLAAVTTGLVVLLEGVLHSRNIIDAEVIGSVIAYAWIWTLISSSAFSHLETIAVVLISLYCLTAMYQIMKKSVNPIWLVLRLLLFGSAILAVLTTAAFLTEKNSYVNVNDGSTNVQRVSWDEYNLNCNRLAWKTSSVAETVLNCTEKYERMPSFVTWDGKVDGVKISALEYSSSGSLSVNFEILLVIDPPVEPEVRSGWDILPGSPKKDKEFRSVISLVINTDDIVGAENKKEAITRLVNFKPGDKVEFHGLLKKGAGSLKPEIGDVQMIRCLKCARNDYMGHSYTSNSVSASALKPYKTYLGNDLFELLSELEAEYRYWLEYLVKSLRQTYSL